MMQDGAIKTDRDICRIIEQDMWMMEILRDVRWLGLPDSWGMCGICAGEGGDVLHGYEHRSLPPDVDVVYYDK